MNADANPSKLRLKLETREVKIEHSVLWPRVYISDATTSRRLLFSSFSRSVVLHAVAYTNAISNCDASISAEYHYISADL